MKKNTGVMLLLAMVMAVALQATDPVKGALQTAVYWTNSNGETRAVLVKEKPTLYTLILIDGGNYEVFYRTAVNTVKKVRRKCEEEKSGSPQVRYFSIPHSFSRTTIWMGLEFVKDSTVDQSLSRTFYGSITGKRSP